MSCPVAHDKEVESLDWILILVLLLHSIIIAMFQKIVGSKLFISVASDECFKNLLTVKAHPFQTFHSLNFCLTELNLNLITAPSSTT